MCYQDTCLCERGGGGHRKKRERERERVEGGSKSKGMRVYKGQLHVHVCMYIHVHVQCTQCTCRYMYIKKSCYSVETSVNPFPYLSLEHSLRSDDLLKDVFSHVGVHSTQRVIQQVDVRLLVDRPGKTHSLLLTPTQVDTLQEGGRVREWGGGREAR